MVGLPYIIGAYLREQLAMNLEASVHLAGLLGYAEVQALLRQAAQLLVENRKS
jgi:hypothetical protein